MKFDPVLLAPRMAPMKAAGLWRDETIDVHVQRALKNCPDKLAVVAYASDKGEPVRLTYRELDARVDRVARGKPHARHRLGECFTERTLDSVPFPQSP